MKGFWKTAAGNIISIHSMSDLHINNCIKLINREFKKNKRMNSKLKEFKDELRRRMVFHNPIRLLDLDIV